MKKKLKAFTLMELVVTMIISSIVIGMGYSAYSIIYKQYLNYKSLRTELMDVAGLNAELAANFYHCSRVLKQGENGLCFELKKDKKINFEFSEQYILRKENDLIDTFKVAAKNCVFKYLLDDTDKKASLVHTFSFDSELLKEKVHFYFEKEYSSEIVIKEEITALNNGEN